MLTDTYIQNKGIAKTLIHDNNHNSMSKINWDAAYDGNVANISVDLLSNGKKQHFDVNLDNDDLAKLLTVPSVNQPLHRRLENDFKRPLEFDFSDFNNRNEFNNNNNNNNGFDSGQNFLILPHYRTRRIRRRYSRNRKPPYKKTQRKTSKRLTHISSPVGDLLVPLTINKKSSQKHKAHKVYKIKSKSSKNSKTPYSIF